MRQGVHDGEVDGVGGEEVDVLDGPCLAGAVGPGQALQVVAQVEAQAVVDAVAGFGQGYSQASCLDLDGQYAALLFPFLYLLDAAG